MVIERKMTDEQKLAAARAYCWGVSQSRLAKKYGVSVQTISEAVRKHRKQK